MDEVRQLVERKAKEKGKNLASLSRQIGKNHAYLQQFIKRGIPLYLDEDVRELLAPLLDLEPNDLRPGRANTRGITRPIPATARPLSTGDPPKQEIDSTVPLLGQGSAGRNGRFPFNGDRVTNVPAPSTLARVRGAYAIYVVGDSMEPRYEAGEKVFVDPSRPVLPGDYVVAQIAEAEGEAPSGYIKQFVGIDDKTLRLYQLNPRKKLTFPSTKVVSVHKIVFGGAG